jgi:hypothetical protein
MYSYARLSDRDLGFVRLIGNGLGNLLFPWARCVIATRRYGLRPIAPTWFQIQMGPILRNERDKRFYRDLFLTPRDAIRGGEKRALLRRERAVKEEAFLRDPHTTGGGVVVFEGLRGQFRDILREHALVREELLAIARPEHKRGLDFDFGNSVTVHVRMGDFFVTRDTAILQSGQMGYRIPIGWYADRVNELRQRMGKVRVHVFSDGTDAELAELLALENCGRLSFGSSLADLLAMSRAHVLVGSASTFGQWAAYLGRMPAVWHRGQARQLYYEKPEAEAECGMGGGIPSRFLDLVCGETRGAARGGERRAWA